MSFVDCRVTHLFCYKDMCFQHHRKITMKSWLQTLQNKLELHHFILFKMEKWHLINFFQVHLQRDHLKVRDFKCDLCSKTFFLKSDLVTAASY